MSSMPEGFLEEMAAVAEKARAERDILDALAPPPPDYGLERRFVYHWLSREALGRFGLEGVYPAYWRHYVLSADRYVTGISTSDEPMLWSPDEGKPREPCLVVDTSRVAHEIHAIRSSSAFWLTRRLEKAGSDVVERDTLLRENRDSERRWPKIPDEYFIEGDLGWDCVAAVGFQAGGPSRRSAAEVASVRGLPLLDMRGWTHAQPALDELDGIIEEALSAAGRAPTAAPQL